MEPLWTGDRITSYNVCYTKLLRLIYSSTEGEAVIKALQMETSGSGQISKWKKKKLVTENETEVRNTTDSEKRKKQEEFEAMKKKTKKILYAGISYNFV